MNSLDKMEDYDRLARLCEAKDAEIAKLIDLVRNQQQCKMDAYEEIEQSQAQIAMLHNALKVSYEYCPNDDSFDYIEQIISATSETVAAFRAKETEPLRMEVAMLRGRLEDYMAAAPELCDDNDENAMRDTQATSLAYEREVENRGAVKALEDASEYFAGMFTDSCPQANIEKELQRMAAKLRAADKGESK